MSNKIPAPDGDAVAEYERLRDEALAAARSAGNGEHDLRVGLGTMARWAARVITTRDALDRHVLPLLAQPAASENEILRLRAALEAIAMERATRRNAPDKLKMISEFARAVLATEPPAAQQDADIKPCPICERVFTQLPACPNAAAQQNVPLSLTEQMTLDEVKRIVREYFEGKDEEVRDAAEVLQEISSLLEGS